MQAGRDVVVRFAGAAAASRFAGKIQAFLDEYLVAEDPRGVVFGGRDEEFERLDRWLADPGAPPRFLLTAPAGRGKSALLVHWIERLRGARGGDGDERWDLVFVPISIRFRTNRPEVFFEAIAARVAEITGDDLPPPGGDPASHYEDQCRLLLEHAIEREQRILLVVDGLDESLGDRFSASWFPRGAGRTLRLVVSARLQVGDRDAKGWADRLGWRGAVRAETRELPPLPRQGVADLLAGVAPGGAPAALSPGFAAAVHALTGGEPLLLKLLVEDLQEQVAEGRAVTVEDLRGIRPGLAGYFADWLDRQRELWRSERREGAEVDEAALSAYLVVLACAHGPVMAEELNEIAGRLHPIPATVRTQEALHPLRRFVIGTGRRAPDGGDTGFVLSHPRLGEFLREEHFDAAFVRRARAAFVDWGKALLARMAEDGRLPPAQVPAYALEYLGQHLDDEEAPPAVLMALTEEPWMRAWEALEGGYRGFARDVARADAAVAARGEPGQPSTARRLRCRLVISSIASSGANIPPALLVRCVREDLLPVKQALAWAEYQRPEGRAATLAGLAPLVAEAERAPLVERALDAAVIGYDVSPSVARALAGLLPLMDGASVRRTFALICSRQLWTGNPMGGFVEAVGAALPDEAVRRACLALLSSDPDLDGSDGRAWSGETRLLGALAPHLTAPLVRRAVSLVEEGAVFEPEAKLVLLGARVQDGRAGLSEDRILEAIGGVVDPLERGRLLALLSPALDATHLGAAVQLALRIERELPRAWALRALADRVDAGLAARTLDALPEHPSVQEDAEARIALARRLHEGERAARLAALLSDCRRAGGRAWSLALMAAAPFLSAAELDHELLRARTLVGPALRARTLGALLPHVEGDARAALEAAVLDVARGIDDTGVLVELATARPASAALAELALDAVARLPRAWERSEGIARLAPALDARGAERALGLVAGLGDPVWRLDALGALAPVLPPDAQGRVVSDLAALVGLDRLHEGLALLAPFLDAARFETALDAAREIPDDDRRLDALAALTEHLPRTALGRALGLAREIGDAGERARLLVGLARALAGADQADPLVVEAVACVESMRFDRARAVTVAALARDLPPEAASRELARLPRYPDPGPRCVALGGLASVLGAAACGAALDAARRDAAAIEGDQARCEAMLHLIPFLDGEARDDALRRTYAAARASPEEDRARFLARFLDHLPVEGLALAPGEGDEAGEAHQLTFADARAAAMAVVARLEWDELRGLRVGDMLRHFPEEARAAMRAEFVAALRGTGWWGASDWIGSVGTLPEADRSGIVRQAFAAACEAPQGAGDASVCEAIAALTPYLPGPPRTAALAPIVARSGGLARPRLLGVLAGMLPALADAEGAPGLLEIARAVRETSRWFR